MSNTLSLHILGTHLKFLVKSLDINRIKVLFKIYLYHYLEMGTQHGYKL